MNMKTPRLVTILIGGIALCVMAAGTNAPLSAQSEKAPLWKALRYNKTNMRVGPSREYPIDWEYRRKGLPVKVLRSRDEWDLVVDPDGTKGWISESQLTLSRSAIVTGQAPVDMRDEPQTDGKMLWQAAPGVVAKLLRCRDGWCEIENEGRAGWVEAERLWGDEELSDEP